MEKVSLKLELLNRLNKYNKSNFQEGYNEIEMVILDYKNQYSKLEVINLLQEIYDSLNNEIQEEILGDFMNRLHGFCLPKNQIHW